MTHALSVIADAPVSVSDDGEPVTSAQLAAAWLWGVARDGFDVRVDADGGPTMREPVSTRDRLTALNSILGRIEPENKGCPDTPGIPFTAESLRGVKPDALRALIAIGGIAETEDKV